LTATVSFSLETLQIDAASAATRIQDAIREFIFTKMKRKGAIVAISGGIDSSVVAALCCRALGNGRVFGLMLPEAESSPDSLRLAQVLADSLGIKTQTEDISPLLSAAGCYERRDEAIRSLIPEYTPAYKCKLSLPDLLDSASYALFSVVVESPDGIRTKARLTPEAYLGIVAATNFKQRTRKMMEYYYADRYNYAVAGTPNRAEYDQGFFVKNGDGAADLKPIAHLYKTQVYQLAAFLGVPEEIQHRPPTTDTYSLDQSQEEFYFAVSYDKMDYCLYGKNNGVSPEEVASVAGLTVKQVHRMYQLIDGKRRATGYLHMGPFLVERIAEV
jgi:NAD+ synthase